MIEKRLAPDINPAILIGVALSFLPKSLLQLSAKKLTNQISILHPGLVERLVDANGKRFFIVLSDTNFNALLNIDGGKISCQLIEKDIKFDSDVTIYGSSEVLLALLEGRCDGDALFFSRKLTVEGDTEALLILRNALDNEQILLREMVCSLFEPLSGVASHISKPLEKLGRIFVRDVNWIYHSAMSPLIQSHEVLSEKVIALEYRFKKVESALQKRCTN